MAIDLRKLRPGELCLLVNSTPLGEVISERKLQRHRLRAGMRIGDGRHVDLVRYVAWLVQLRHAPKIEPINNSYEAHKDRARARNIALSLAGRDIGELPEVVDPERKNRGASDFRFFCEQYFPFAFYLPWSPDHLKVIDKIEQAVLRGGLFALAMPRGSGKTTISECACIWAVLYGHHDFVCLIGSDEGHAVSMLESIKTELEGNDLLLADFPEAVYPIHCLEGIANRCAGQIYKGENTHIGWTAKEIILPTIPGSKASGAIIKVAGITGRIRGMKHKRVDGKAVRPSLVVIDDPQTDESARSSSQCAQRESILAGAVLGLAGPGKKISGIMPCTVIRPGDMADNILNRDKHPEWNGERTKMVYSFPKNQDLWKAYAVLREQSLKNGGRGEEATEFYRQNRAAMDEGAVVAWPERFNYDELSAIQHAMNLKLRDEVAFFAEYQNEPMAIVSANEMSELGFDLLMLEKKISHLPRRVVPAAASRLVAGVDIQKSVLFFVVCAFDESFNCWVVDYGAWPDQGGVHFRVSSAVPLPLEVKYPSSSLDQVLFRALRDLVVDLRDNRNYVRQQSEERLSLNRVLIDCNWSVSTETVMQFASLSEMYSLVIPSRGRSSMTALKPMNEWRVQAGERAGWNWRLIFRPRRTLIFEANEWKTFIAQRIRSEGSGGSLYFYDAQRNAHRMLFDHMLSETPNRIKNETTNRDIIHWSLSNPGEDNHFWDCLVLCYVGASELGLKWRLDAERMVGSSRVVPAPRGEAVVPGRERKYVSLQELQNMKERKMRSGA